jgi:hypothetical protein
VGTAAYRVYRDRTFLGQTGLTSFLDTGLAEARRYTYRVQAVDASQNRSKMATVTVKTPDTTAPSAPANLSVAAGIVDSQVNLDLTWSPSIDNVGVTMYRIYKGTSPADLLPVGTSSTPSFTITNALPESIVYCAVSAVDAAGNNSAQSAPAGIAVPPIPDVTPPTVQIGYPTEGTVVGRTTYLYASLWDLRGGLYDVPSGPASVQFQIDDADVGREQFIPYDVTEQYSLYRLEINTAILSNGSHRLTAVGRDLAGNRAVSDTVTFIVRNN